MKVRTSRSLTIGLFVGLLLVVAVGVGLTVVRSGRQQSAVPEPAAVRDPGMKSRPALPPAPSFSAQPQDATVATLPRPLVLPDSRVLLLWGASVGWSLALLLGAALVLQSRHWRASFKTKEWLLMPDDQATKMQDLLQALAHTVIVKSERLGERIAATGEEARAAGEAVRLTREEFSILRDELDRKSKDVAILRMGTEYHVRRPVLLRVIRSLDIIEDDLKYDRDLRQTIEGIRVELRECLEDNAVSIVEPAVGTPIAEARGVDAQGARREPTSDEALCGMIAGVSSPAYIARGHQGSEEIIVPARVRVYVIGDKS